jgi:hypothetical protein
MGTANNYFMFSRGSASRVVLLMSVVLGKPGRALAVGQVGQEWDVPGAAAGYGANDGLDLTPAANRAPTDTR